MDKRSLFRSCAPVALLLALLLTLSACGSNAAGDDATQPAPTLTAEVSQDPKFDAAVFSLTAEDFAQAGFSFGDSCDVTFSSGYSLTDVPYYNGYYVKTGDPVIVAYPKNDYVQITHNNRGFWTPVGLESGCTAEITLNTAGKYLATYEALGQSYSTDRSDYASDEAFANFRAMSGGALKEDFLYRGASPVDDSRGRAAVVDALLERTGIRCVIDLADSAEEMEAYFASEGFSSAYTKALYEEGRDIPLDMGANYDSDAYQESVAQGMRQLLKYGGPAYIHCMEGKDRTGFVCLLLEALVGASYEEMCADYMATYDNYYQISQAGTPERYDAVVALYFDAFLEYLYGTDDVSVLKTADYTQAARSYLTDCGMTEQEIGELIALISR